MAAVPTHIDWTNLMLHDTKQKRLRLPMLSINTSFTQVLEDGAAKLTRSSFFTEETLETALEQVRNRQLILSAAVTEISDALADLQTRFTEMVRVSTLLTRIRALPVVPLPDLPLDILRTILEIHAGTSPRNASNLSVVSPQVQQWTDPALFRTIILREESYGQRDAFVDMFAGQTPLSKRVSQGLEMTRVVHLTSPLPLPVVERFINLCPAIYQLSIHGAKLGPLLILNQPHLRHMACNLQYFVSSVAPTPDISASQLHNLESFKITTKYSVWSQWDLTTLRRLPRLRYIEVFASRPENADILRGVLQGRLIPSFPYSRTFEKDPFTRSSSAP
ncbi:hypothetical protein DL96DRAFT_1595412 [Flagelloscypha sp. PMI_526]|nr:hypothetical protein DL96DRAFT_1595412 [Flagelloscypha sp. PMI_526]